MDETTVGAAEDGERAVAGEGEREHDQERGGEHDGAGAAREDLPLLRARALIAEAIRRRWDEGLLARDPDGVFTAFLGSDHVERLMEGRTAAGGVSGALAGLVAGAEVEWDERSAIGRLRRLLRLSPSQVDLLAVLLACETDPGAARLMSYLGGNQSQFSVTVDLAFEAVYRGRTTSQLAASALLHHDLVPAGPLRRLRMLIVDGADNRVALAQGVRLHPRIVDFLVQGGGMEADLTAVATLYPPFRPVGECAPADLAAAAAAFRARGRLLLIEGPPRSGRELLIRFAAAEVGRPLLSVSARGLTADRMVAAFREAIIQSALLALRDVEDLADGEVQLRLRECLSVFPDTVALVGPARVAPQYAGLRPLTCIEVKVPPHGERRRLWAEHLGEHTDIDEDELRRIAGLYNLGIGGILAASDAAIDTARFSGEAVRRGHVTLAVRQLFESDLSTVASRLDVSQTWDDVVLPEELTESITGLIDRIELRGNVLGDWGFARKLGKGLGLAALFSGEPGTGKSMVAGLIAKDLGLDLYVVDLSRITSKWLGETEKNLARAFDAAEAGHVMLLFDEADSVLGKRSSDMKSSNDRHANLETNFILARLEQFQGIAIFTTNLASAIDPAIARRMASHLKFPFPDVETRSQLWRRMIPAEAPVDEEIDYDHLATRFEVSGGFIRNIVVRAAYLAARQGQAIGMPQLEWAAEQEYRERGSLLVGGRLV